MRPYSSAACGTERVRGDGEVGFQLGQHHLCATQHGQRHIGRCESRVRAGIDYDLIFTGTVQQNYRRAGWIAGFPRDAAADLFGAVEFFRLVGRSVAAHRADEERPRPGAAGRDGLVGALATLTAAETPDHGLPAARKLRADQGQVLHDAADDDDLR